MIRLIGANKDLSINIIYNNLSISTDEEMERFFKESDYVKLNYTMFFIFRIENKDEIPLYKIQTEKDGKFIITKVAN